MKQPCITVIIPTFNCVNHLSQCLDSLASQSFRDFETIIVDDGSSDGSLELAQRFASKHRSVSVLQQLHAYAGVARNLGMDNAKGEYLLFLDGDDFFNPRLLEKAYQRAAESNADICCFGALSLDDASGAIAEIKHSCRSYLCPSTGIFNRRSNPRYLYCFTTPAPWTKLFKRSFIKSNNLRFQNTRSANDFCFVHLALSVAETIVVLDDHLVTYRQNNAKSLQATQDKDPFAFFQALTALLNELKKRNLHNELQHTFTNTALDFCMYNLRTLSHNREAQREVFEFLKNEGFEKLELENKPRDYFYVYPASRYDDFLVVQNGTFEDYVAHLSGKSNKGLKARLKKAARSVIPVRASAFEKSKRDLQKELDLIKEQNRNLEDKLNALLEEIHELKRREPDAENVSEQ